MITDIVKHLINLDLSIVIYDILTVIIIYGGIIMEEIIKENAQFTYVAFKRESWPLDIVSYRDELLVNIESKHVAFRNDATNIFFTLSELVGYENTILGIHRTPVIKNEYLRIKNMSESPCLRAVRFVITKDNHIWSDNTHWTLAYLYKYGTQKKVCDIPLYIIDFRSSTPVIYDCDGVVFDSLSDIRNALAAAKSIQERLDLGWRPENISYTIGQLYCDMEKIVTDENTL